MTKTRNKIDQMSTADWQQYHQLLSNQQLMKYFADEVHRFSRSPMKPDDVLRRFSLNGDGHLDLREFQLAATRLEIVSSSSRQSDGSCQESQYERDLQRAKELYLVFCPSQTRKLDIDLFCRIMTEWSLQLMRASYQQNQTSQVTSSMSSLSTDKQIQYSSPRAPLATPYATQATLNVSRTSSNNSKGQKGGEGDVDSSGRGTRLMEGEALWQRISTSVAQNSEKLRQIFLKMDVMSSGKISPEELELALSHIGVFLTTREYEKLYAALGEGVKEYTRDGASNGRWRGRGGNGNAFAIKYAEFLLLFQEKDGVDHRVQALPSNSRQVSPPVVGVGNARVWDSLVAAFDKLQPLFLQYARIGQYHLSPESFRECLLRCGITLSNADFAALRVRLLPFSHLQECQVLPLAPLVLALRRIQQENPHKRGMLSDNKSTSDPFFSTGKPPPALEARILAKLQQLKQLGQLSASSAQSVFPGDRFGHISRGQFRQSLVHLNLLVRRLPRSVQKVLEKMLVELPRLQAICERMDTTHTGMISTTEMIQATHELGVMASIADNHAAIEALSRDRFHEQGTAPPDQIPYHSLEDRLGAICSDLLSPKKRKKHLSTTSVLLAPYEDRTHPIDVTSSYNQDPHHNDALWNCPRRRMVQDHRAARSSIRIADEMNNPADEHTPIHPPKRPTSVEDAKSRQERRHRIALVGVLQDLLERRSDLKTALDLHRRSDARGQVTKKDLAEILLTSRLNLHFPTGAVAAQELVDELYPSLRPESGLGFLEVLRRISELLGEVTKELSLAPPSSGNGPPSTFSTNPYQQPQRPSGRKLNASLDIHSSVLPTTTGLFSNPSSFPNPDVFAGSATTVRRKLLQDSRLKDLLSSDYGLQSAAVLVRHAFKGLASREMVVPIDNGEFEAMCRASDIKHVCYRLGLDLDLHEQQFVASSVDTGDSGFVSSPGLLNFFSKLAQIGDYSAPSSFSKEKDIDADMRRVHRVLRILSFTFTRVRCSLQELRGDCIAMATVPSGRGLPRLKYTSGASQQLTLTKDAAKMNRVTSGIGGALDSVQMRIEMLTREIKADEKGKKDYDELLFRLNERRRDLDAKLRECREWSTLFESKIKPLAGKYAETTDGMQGQYNDAKLRHAQGITVLMENFDYHPEFKRFSDTFSAVPFKPK
uniref:EF-hand domain-containing protein n=2 Tax=Phytophthora ramorum TaxID=164328 RepID=H3GTU1_PHYRM